MKTKEYIVAIKEAKGKHSELEEALELLLKIVNAPEISVGDGLKGVETGKLEEGFPLADRRLLSTDLTPLKERFLALIEMLLVKKQDKASRVISCYQDVDRLRELMEGALSGDSPLSRDSNAFLEDIESSKPVVLFASGEALYPIFEELKGEVNDEMLKGWKESFCPICGAMPNFSSIRGEENRLYLFCSRCSMEWNHPRIKCPFCGETEQKLLRYFEAKEDETPEEGDKDHLRNYRVYVCDTCKHYIKALDEREMPDTISKESFYPRLEDILTIEFDIVARREGYVRETVDLVGLLLMETYS